MRIVKKEHDIGMIEIVKLCDGSIQLSIDEDGCKFLIEELQYLMCNKSYTMEYPQNTGYDCGILTEKSLGLYIVRKDFE